MRENEITEILDRPTSRELLARDLTRLAYVAKDGTPRNGSEVVMCTTKNAPKLPALRKNPMVALTIDTEVHPPVPDTGLGRRAHAARGRRPDHAPDRAGLPRA